MMISLGTSEYLFFIEANHNIPYGVKSFTLTVGNPSDEIISKQVIHRNKQRTED